MILIVSHLGGYGNLPSVTITFTNYHNNSCSQEPKCVTFVRIRKTSNGFTLAYLAQLFSVMVSYLKSVDMHLRLNHMH